MEHMCQKSLTSLRLEEYIPSIALSYSIALVISTCTAYYVLLPSQEEMILFREIIENISIHFAEITFSSVSKSTKLFFFKLFEALKK